MLLANQGKVARGGEISVEAASVISLLTSFRVTIRSEGKGGPASSSLLQVLHLFSKVFRVVRRSSLKRSVLFFPCLKLGRESGIQGNAFCICTFQE